MKFQEGIESVLMIIKGDCDEFSLECLSRQTVLFVRIIQNIIHTTE